MKLQTDILGRYVGEVETFPQLIGIFRAFEVASIDDRLQARDAVSVDLVWLYFEFTLMVHLVFSTESSYFQRTLFSTSIAQAIRGNKVCLRLET